MNLLSNVPAKDGDRFDDEPSLVGNGSAGQDVVLFSAQVAVRIQVDLPASAHDVNEGLVHPEVYGLVVNV